MTTLNEIRLLTAAFAAVAAADPDRARLAAIAGEAEREPGLAPLARAARAVAAGEAAAQALSDALTRHCRAARHGAGPLFEPCQDGREEEGRRWTP